MNRRNFLQALVGTSALAALPRLGFGNPGPEAPFWIKVQASGAWDPALLFDPKPTLRTRLAGNTFYLYGVPTLTSMSGTGTIMAPGSTELRTTPGGGIPYLGFADLHGDPLNPAHPYKCFLPTFYDRITLINGVDTGTVNHEVGARYCASGSLNEGYPCFASQVASVCGSDRALSFLNMGGYDETAGIIAASRLDGNGLPSLLRLINGGTDHWQVGSVMIVQNNPAKSLNLGLPTNKVIGGTTGGNETQALRSQRVNPSTLALDSNGVLITPGHVLRVLRRLAKIADSPKLVGFPLTVDKDLALG